MTAKEEFEAAAAQVKGFKKVSQADQASRGPTRAERRRRGGGAGDVAPTCRALRGEQAA